MSNSNQPRPRVVITGFGLVSPFGLEPDAVWDHLAKGRSAIAPLENLPTEALPFSCGGEARDFTGNIADYGPLEKPAQRAIKKNMKVMCREIEMSVAAAQRALHHSGLGGDRDPDRCGCLFGCDYILTRPEEFEDGFRHCLQKTSGPFKIEDWPLYGLAKVNPLWLLKYLPNMPNSHVSIYNDFRGPNNAITGREASMNLAMSEASSIIERGAADVMLVGATGCRIHPLRTAQTAVIETLASQREDPAEMCRPFDASCDGSVIGEGAGVIVLESLEHAQSRGAKLWGEVVGRGASMGTASEAGIQQAVGRALTQTLASAKAMPKQWHLHAQGTSCPAFDRAEASAMADVLEGKGHIAVTAAQALCGNLGAGGAAVQLIASLLAMEHGQLFAIKNLENPIAEATWHPAEQGEPAGDGFVHTSFTLQGQVSCLAIAAAS